MPYLSVYSLPKIRFAHTYSATDYHNYFKPSSDIIEITYVSKGHLHYHAESYDFTATEGDIVVNTYTHALTVDSEGFHEHHTTSFLLKYDVTNEPCKNSLPFSLHVLTPSECCRNLIDEIIRNQTIYNDSGLKCSGLFLQLIYELSKNVYKDASNFGSYLYVKKAKNYIFEHIHEPIKQTDIAQYLGITPEYLCSIFKQCENTTMMSYINRVKLESIASTMSREHLPLYKAAELYGYSDANYVSRLYKKMFQTNITDVILKN